MVLPLPGSKIMLDVDKRLNIVVASSIPKPYIREKTI